MITKEEYKQAIKDLRRVLKIWESGIENEMRYAKKALELIDKIDNEGM